MEGMNTLDYMVRHHVSKLLCNGLQMLSPYPWEAHFELAKQITWGTYDNYNHAKEALDRVGWMTSLRPTPFTRYVQSNAADRASRTASVMMVGNDTITFSAAGQPHQLPQLSGVERQLLSEESIDSFVWQNGVLTYGTGGFSLLAPDTSRDAVVDWLHASEPFIRDVVDVHNLILRIMVQMTRDWYPVAKLLYPDYDTVFPRHVSAVHVRQSRDEFNKGRPLNPKFRRKLVHPDDDEVIAAVFDRAAAARVTDNVPARFGNVAIYV